MKKKLRAIVEDSHFFYLKTLLFYEKNIPKNKTLYLGIKSGAEGSEVELFWGGFGCYNKRLSSRIILVGCLKCLIYFISQFHCY